MKTLLIFIFLFTSMIFAHEKGNGGSGSEAQLVAEQAELVQIANKIQIFFLKYPNRVRETFPQVSSFYLSEKVGKMRIEVSNQKLKDRHGISRTCINYAESSYIHCNFSELQKIKKNPKAKFVLVLHEILGLLNIEETSPENTSYIEGYRISKSIAPYVTKVADYDLRLQKDQVNPINYLKEGELYVPKAPKVCNNSIEKNLINNKIYVEYVGSDCKPRGQVLEYSCKGFVCTAYETVYVRWSYEKKYLKRILTIIPDGNYIIKILNYNPKTRKYEEGDYSITKFHWD